MPFKNFHQISIKLEVLKKFAARGNCLNLGQITRHKVDFSAFMASSLKQRKNVFY